MNAHKVSLWVLSGATVTFVAIGAILVGMGRTEADDPLEGLRIATPFPRPDERSALTIDEAKAQLSEIDGLGDVIEASESVDVPRLLDLAQTGTVDCAQAGRSAPHECEGQPSAVLTTVQQQIDGVYAVPRAVSTMDGWLHEFFDGQTLALVLASRDGREAEGVGGKYFLVFESAELRERGARYGSLALVVRPGREDPIEEFAFLTADASSLQWIQEIDPHFQVLIAPETVESWRGRWEGWDQ